MRPGRFVTIRDLMVLEIRDAMVAQCDAMDIGSEIFERTLPIADWDAINNPVLAPYFGWHLRVEFKFFESIA